MHLQPLDMRIILIAAAVSVLSVNCGNSSAEEQTASASSDTSKPTLTVPSNNPTGVTVPNSITSGTNSPATQQATTPITTPQVKTGAGLNPAHGQPGHRCEIPVGAPLDSKPTTTTQNAPPINIQAQNSPANMTVNGPPPANLTLNNPPPSAPVINQPSSLTTVGAGMNPAHGQPGHRCDIAVGAPLNSKPTTSAQVIPAKPPGKQ